MVIFFFFQTDLLPRHASIMKPGRLFFLGRVAGWSVEFSKQNKNWRVNEMLRSGFDPASAWTQNKGLATHCRRWRQMRRQSTSKVMQVRRRSHWHLLHSLSTFRQYWHLHLRFYIPQSFFDECRLTHNLPQSGIQWQHVTSPFFPWTSPFYWLLCACVTFV